MKRQTVKKLIQCVAIIAAGVLAIILFMLANSGREYSTEGNRNSAEAGKRTGRNRKNNKDIATKSACGTPQALILYAERQEI